MTPFLGEFIGTSLLIILGGGVVANVVLSQTKGNNSGWIVITFGWAIAVFTGVYAATHLGSGGHLNPAVTIALALFGDFDPSLTAAYLGGQFAGAFIGAVVVWMSYKLHFDATTDPQLQLAVFSTAPAIRHPFFNLLTEIIGTFVLVFGVLLMPKSDVNLGTLNALPVGLLVLGIGLSLGGPTGYAINPARDLGPRLAHALLPMKGKGGSDWKYSWIPVIGPVIGGLLAAFLVKVFGI
jgi:glycerol uptake facilitator protein